MVRRRHLSAELRTLLSDDPELEALRASIEAEQAAEAAEAAAEAAALAASTSNPLAGGGKGANVDEDDIDVEALLQQDPELRALFGRFTADESDGDDNDGGPLFDDGGDEGGGDFFDMMESIETDPDLTPKQKMEAKLAIQGMYNSAAPDGSEGDAAGSSGSGRAAERGSGRGSWSSGGGSGMEGAGRREITTTGSVGLAADAPPPALKSRPRLPPAK